MQNWKEGNVWSSTVYSCDFHEGRQHFITLLMFVLNFVLFFNLFTVDNISSHCWCLCWILLSKDNLTINMQLLLLLWPAKFSQPGTISVRGTVLYRASSFLNALPLYKCVVLLSGQSVVCLQLVSYVLGQLSGVQLLVHKLGKVVIWGGGIHPADVSPQSPALCTFKGPSTLAPRKRLDSY